MFTKLPLSHMVKYYAELGVKMSMGTLDSIAERDVEEYGAIRNYSAVPVAIKGQYFKDYETDFYAKNADNKEIKTVFSDISQEVIDEGLRKVKHPCRFQYIREKNLIIDGAHNPNGIEALKTSLDECFPNIKRRFIFGCLKNKDYKKMLGLLFKEDDEIYFYHFSHANSCDFETLQAACSVESKELTSDTKIDFNDGHLNIICGSFYMISEFAQKFDILRNI